MLIIAMRINDLEKNLSKDSCDMTFISFWCFLFSPSAEHMFLYLLNKQRLRQVKYDSITFSRLKRTNSQISIPTFRIRSQFLGDRSIIREIISNYSTRRRPISKTTKNVCFFKAWVANFFDF